MKKWQKIAGLIVAAAVLFVAGIMVGGVLNEDYYQTHVIPNLQRKPAEQDQDINYAYTGADIWRELNIYRLAKGLDELELSELACADIGERWNEVSTNIRETGEFSHVGIQDFRNRQVSKGVWPSWYGPAEVLSYGSASAKEVISSLNGSPSHSLTISDPTLRYGCVFSERGLTVILLHTQK